MEPSIGRSASVHQMAMKASLDDCGLHRLLIKRQLFHQLVTGLHACPIFSSDLKVSNSLMIHSGISQSECPILDVNYRPQLFKRWIALSTG